MSRPLDQRESRVFTLAAWIVLVSGVPALLSVPLISLSAGRAHTDAVWVVMVGGALAGAGSATMWSLYHRATGRWFQPVRRPRPPELWARLKAEWRFGHKPWHSIALLVGSLALGWVAMVTSARSRATAVGLGAAAMVLVAYAFWSARRQSDRRSR